MALQGFLDQVLARLVGLAMFLAVVCVVGMVFEGLTISDEIGVQRGIDAHGFMPPAVYAEYIKDDNIFSEDQYVVSYPFDDREIRTKLRSLPGHPAIGDPVCGEVDTTRPEHARTCGTRGDLGDAETGMLQAGGVFAATLAFLGLWRWWLRRRWGRVRRRAGAGRELRAMGHALHGGGPMPYDVPDGGPLARPRHRVRR